MSAPPPVRGLLHYEEINQIAFVNVLETYLAIQDRFKDPRTQRFTYLAPSVPGKVEQQFFAHMKSRQRLLPCLIQLAFTRNS